jgi:hypothetical protein
VSIFAISGKLLAGKGGFHFRTHLLLLALLFFALLGILE